MDALLDDLNEPQRQAVTHTDGPLLILAGPGSGKTRVITRRVAYLAECGVAPWHILAITFTNKAAEEMRNRVAQLSGARGFVLSTFHALGARLLREFAEPAGLDPRFVIYDVADRRSVLKKIRDDLDVRDERLTPARLEEIIGHHKDRLLGPQDYLDRADGVLERQAGRIWQRYEQTMRENKAVDFDDLLYRLALLLRDHADVRQHLAHRYRYVMIDEYQDTNHAQYQIARLITAGHPNQPNLCVTGDPDQSIYAWRGADISNILSFEADHPGAAVVKLEENYRSTPQVLRVADQLIAANTQRKAKRLFTTNPAGPAVKLFTADDEALEAAHVAQCVQRYVAGGGRLDDVAVFYRTNALSRALEEAFRRAAIPYRIARGTEFYNRKEIRDLLGYLRVLANPADAVSLLRIINTPARKIGQTTLDRLQSAAAAAGLSLYDALRRADQFPELKSAAGKLLKFATLMDELRGLVVDVPFAPPTADPADAPPGPIGGQAVAPILRRVLELSGLEEDLRATDPERLENVEELVNSAAEYDELVVSTGQSGSLPDWLNQVALVADADKFEGSTGALTMMTLHTAKGLEFPVVFIVGLEEGLLPHRRAVEEGTATALEEERRLLFVGVTRAERQLWLSYARRRMQQGFWAPTIRSQFLRSLDEDALEVLEPEPATDPFTGKPTWTGSPNRPALRWPGERAAPDRSPPTTFAPRRPGLPAARPGLPADRPDPAAPPGKAGGAGANLGFSVGQKVRHAQFGDGQIEALHPMAGLVQATVHFAAAGRRTLILPSSKLVAAS